MKILLISGLLLFTIALQSQNAVNFNCEDCNRTPYDLFDQLDAGKIVVIVWVMPCSTCVLPAKTAFNVANSYESTNPGKVVYYLCDDYGTTSCTSITNWASTNSIVPTAVFSNSLINMSDYGESGMPKMVVLGGSDHKVYDNQNNTFNHIQMSDAIDLAISESTNLVESNLVGDYVSVLYDDLGLTLNYESEENTDISVSVTDYLGRSILKNQQFNLHSGNNSLCIYSKKLTPGFYLVSINTRLKTKTFKVVVN